jgi:hypothetical protein
MGFDWSVNVSVAFSQHIGLHPNVSYWCLLKKLANYEPCESGSKRARGRATELAACDGTKWKATSAETALRKRPASITV